MAYDPSKYQINLNEYPSVITSELPGPKSQALHGRAAKHYRGLSGQVKLFSGRIRKRTRLHPAGCRRQQIH